MKKNNDFLNIRNTCLNFVEKIEFYKKDLVDCLTGYESYDTAEDEISRSLECLKNIDTQFKYFSKRVKNIGVFAPLNLPLYSLVLFGVVSSFFTENVFFRPPLLARKTIRDIYKILNFKKNLPGLKILEVQRKIFIDGCLPISDVIVFTGEYKNAIKIQGDYPDKLFLFNGAGINPILITKSADIDLAIKKLIDMRVFNSGQDCAAPDSIIVHYSIVDELIKKLKNKLSKISIGNYKNKNNLIGKIIEDTHLRFIKKLLLKNKEDIIYGGKIDFNRKIIYPTIITSSIDKSANKYFEFFSPIFNILEYKNNKDLDRYFNSHEYLDHAMYISVFGKSRHIKRIKKSIILQDKIVLDIDDGNKPFGGYGKKASFVSYDGKLISRPILISKEIYYYHKLKEKEKDKYDK